MEKFARRCAIDTPSNILVSSDLMGQGTLVPVLPKAMRDEYVSQMHSGFNCGHLRAPKLSSLIALRCAWPGM